MPESAQTMLREQTTIKGAMNKIIMRDILNKKITFTWGQLSVCMIIFVIGFIFLSGYISLEGLRTAIGPGISKEIEKIKLAKNIDEQVTLYLSLIKRVGPIQAQEQLFRSGLPFTGQTHLINHSVGEYLYEKYGSAGLTKCKEYFLSSCYHGFLIMAIAAEGMPGVSKIMEECRKSGPAVLSQCAHAVGHGFLANSGYKNLMEALLLCDQVDLPSGLFPLFNCYDGVFMENIWAVHEDGTPSPDRWVKEDDPFYPCNDKRIDEKYLLGCWSNQPALMYQQFRGDIKKVGLECEKVPDMKNKGMCFNGLSRQIHPITAGRVDSVFEMCSLLPTEWNNYCVNTNALAYFGVGDTELPFSICNRVIGQENRAECYKALMGLIKNHKNLCDKINDIIWKNICLSN